MSFQGHPGATMGRQDWPGAAKRRAIISSLVLHRRYGRKRGVTFVVDQSAKIDLLNLVNGGRVGVHRTRSVRL